MTSASRAPRASRNRALLVSALLSALAMMALASACGTNTSAPGPAEHEAGIGDVSAPTPDGGGPEDASEDSANADVLVAPNLPRPLSEDAMAPLRQGCTFEAGAWPAQTI